VIIEEEGKREKGEGEKKREKRGEKRKGEKRRERDREEREGKNARVLGSTWQCLLARLLPPILLSRGENGV